MVPISMARVRLVTVKPPHSKYAAPYAISTPRRCRMVTIQSRPCMGTPVSLMVQVLSRKVAALLVGIDIQTPPDVPWTERPVDVALVMPVLYPNLPKVLMSLPLLMASRWCSAILNTSHGVSTSLASSDSTYLLALGPHCVQFPKNTLPHVDRDWTPRWSRRIFCLARLGRFRW